MDFIEYTNTWAKSEVTQGRIMIGIGILLLVALYAIFKSQNELLRGMLIPLGLLTVVLIGYGAVIMTGRLAYAKESLALYEKSKSEALEKENPVLMIISALALLFVSSQYYKGMALGFVLLFVSTYIIDNEFVSRSDAFLPFLNNLQ